MRRNDGFRTIAQKVMRRRLLFVITGSSSLAPVPATTSSALSYLRLLYQLPSPLSSPRYGKTTAEALTDIKNIITQFFLNPTSDNLLAMHQRYRYYVNTDGNRGTAAANVIAESVVSFNDVLGGAVYSGRRLPANTTAASN